MIRFLLVDDEENVLQAIRRELRVLGPSEVEAFSSPLEAPRRAAEQRFDLVLSDYRMPEMDGVKFLHQLTALQPDIARIIISGHQDLELLLNAINKVKVYGFIAKPWDSYTLLDTVAKALSERDLRSNVQRLEDRLEAQAILIREQRQMLEEYQRQLTASQKPSAG